MILAMLLKFELGMFCIGTVEDFLFGRVVACFTDPSMWNIGVEEEHSELQP